MDSSASYYRKGTRISLKYSYLFDYFQGLSTKKHYSLQFLIFGKLGKISYTISSNYNNRTYTPISTTKNKIPLIGISASYKPGKDWIVTLGMTRFGKSKTVTTTNIPGYEQFCKP